MPASRMLACSLIVALATLLATSAHAQAEPAQLTDQGRIMIDGVIGGRWSSHPAHSGLEDRADFRVQAQPGVTYFFVDHVGVGMSVGGEMGRGDLSTWGGSGSARDFALVIGPDATLELPLIDRLSLVTLPGVYYVRQWRRLSVASDRENAGREDPTAVRVEQVDYTVQYLRFALALPLAFHLSSSLAIGFGPTFWLDLFVSQDPRTRPELLEIGPFSGLEAARGEAYSRTRWVFGATSWIGASF